VLIEPGDTGFSVLKQTEDEQALLGQVPAEGLGEVRAMVAAIKSDRKTLVLRLPEGAVLMRQLSFPLAVEENLRRVIGFEMDRLTPFSADKALFDYRVVGRRGAERKLDVQLAVAPKARVDPWLKTLGEEGLSPTVVESADPWPGINLLPPEARSRQGWMRSAANWLLLLLVLGLLAAALVVPLWEKRGMAITLNEYLVGVRREANQVLDLREKLDKNTESARYVLDKRRKTPRVVDVLQELTELIPDDSWVQQLQLREGNLQLRGESALATALLEKLEESPFFSGVGFRSPLVQVPTKTVERYHLAVQVVPKEEP
jgi:general secretion pathway protein L